MQAPVTTMIATEVEDEPGYACVRGTPLRVVSPERWESWGKVGKAPILLLTTVGRKSGQERTLPLGYSRDGGRLLVIASALGAPKHPAWYRNLRDNPRATVRLGAETRQMDAETATGEERARLWQQLIIDFSFFVEHQRKTTREIPVVILSAAKG